MQAKKKATDEVANTRIPGVVDTGGLESLKERAVGLMAESLDKEREHEGLVTRIEHMRSLLAEAAARCDEARDSAAVLRLRAGGAFREVRVALKPEHGWNRWKAELKRARGWASTTIDEAIELFTLAEGDESRVKGMTISGALRGLRVLREQGGARPRERMQQAAARQQANERAGTRETTAGQAGETSLDAAGRLGEARSLLGEWCGEGWDPDALVPDDLLALARMVGGRPSPGLSRLRSAWDQADRDDRDAFLLWLKGAGR